MPIRAHLAEFGIVAPIGRHGVEQLLGVVSDAMTNGCPTWPVSCVAALGAHLQRLKVQILEFDRHDQSLAPIQRGKSAARRHTRRRVRPWPLLWLQASLIRRCSGQEETSRPRSVSCPNRTRVEGKDRLGNISKRGDRYLRSLFTTGALAVIRYAKIHGTKHRPWSPHC